MALLATDFAAPSPSRLYFILCSDSDHDKLNYVQLSALRTHAPRRQIDVSDERDEVVAVAAGLVEAAPV